MVYKVRAGTTLNMQGGSISTISKYWNHPKFTREYDFDVSVLKLDNPFKLSENIQLIPLQPVGQKVPDGKIGTVTGWGDLKYGGSAPDALQEVGVPKATDSLCKMNEILYKVTDRMVCFGFLFGGKDACQVFCNYEILIVSN